MSSFTLRKFKFQTLTKPEGAGEGLLDIPHPLILRYKSPQDLIKEFDNTWGMAPKGVILPVVVTDGLSYENKEVGLPTSRYAQSEGQYLGFEKTVEAFGKEACIEKIYLSVDPTLQFVTMDGLHVVDIAGDGSQQVCIGNPRTQELLGAILGGGIDIALNVLGDHKKKLAGAMIDAVDLWPQGADNDRLELTCFCESCLNYFKTEDQGLITKFKDFPNPWNFVLKDNKTGIGYIDDLPKDITPQQIIGLSRQKGYLEIFKDKPQPELEQLARDLLRYIQVRHNQTVNALHKIFDEAFQGLDGQGISLQRIVLLEGIHLDWTSGLQLQRLDEPDKDIKPFDEIWFNSTSSDMITKKVPFRSYMWRRSRYLIDAFFQAVANATDPGKRTTTGIARWSQDEIREELLRKRFRGAISTSDSKKTSLAALPLLKGTPSSNSQRVGFVGVAFLSEEDGNKFIDGLVVPPSGAVSLRKSGSGLSSNDDMLLSLLRKLGQSKE